MQEMCLGPLFIQCQGERGRNDDGSEELLEHVADQARRPVSVILLGTMPGLTSVLSLVASALKFTSHAPFINPSLASPDLVAVEKDHLVWADSRLNAVFFTTGCVSACNLITPAPGINNGAAVKKLLLFPIEGIFQDGLDYFGCKFKVTQAAGQISNGMVTYATKKEGHTVYSSSSSKFLHFPCISLSLIIFISSGIMGSPKKKGLFKKSASQSATTPGGGYPVSLSFGDNGTSRDARSPVC